AEAARAGLLLALAEGADFDPAAAEAAIARGADAVFPLAARDLVAAGVAPGPALGERLRAAEAAWIESGFALDKSALLTQFGGAPDA
ncbi:MAG: CCA tRNA nucleotidyltransferase, partial [Paracoccaceae bacterium]